MVHSLIRPAISWGKRGIGVCVGPIDYHDVQQMGCNHQVVLGESQKNREKSRKTGPYQSFFQLVVWLTSTRLS